MIPYEKRRGDPDLRNHLRVAAVRGEKEKEDGDDDDGELKSNRRRNFLEKKIKKKKKKEEEDEEEEDSGMMTMMKEVEEEEEKGGLHSDEKESRGGGKWLCNSGSSASSFRNWRQNFDGETLNYVLEDVRLSTLQRKLVRESNEKVSVALAHQIVESIRHPDNKSYVRRAQDVINDAIIAIFYSKHGNIVKSLSSQALSQVGILMVTSSSEFNHFYKWIWEKATNFKTDPAIQFYFFKSLALFIQGRPNIQEHQILQILQDVEKALEKTENSEIMTVLVDSLDAIAKWKKKIFQPHFQDIVDILIGWHIDSSQPTKVRGYMSQILLSWNSYWVVDMEFSSSLLKQFIEDMSELTEDIETEENTDNDLIVCGERILSLIQVYNTVFSCLQSQQHVVSFLPPESSSTWPDILSKCLTCILNKRFEEDIAISGQNAYSLMIDRIDTLFVSHGDAIYDFLVDFNLNHYDHLSFHAQIATLKFTGKIFSLSDSTKQTNLVNLINNSEYIQETASSYHKPTKEAFVQLYCLMLDCKNVMVLQLVYGHLIELFESSLKKPIYNSKKSDNIFFVLGCLSNLALARGSVLSMWALDPPIFKFFANRSHLLDQEFQSNDPWIHHGILKLLYTHCSKLQNFIGSSKLGTSSSYSTITSPSADYFENILILLTKLVDSPSLICVSRLMIFEWISGLFSNSTAKSLRYFNDTRGILNLIESLVQFTSSPYVELSTLISVLKIIQKLLSNNWFLNYEFNMLSNDILRTIHQTCTFHMKMEDEIVKSLCLSIVQLIPPSKLNGRNAKEEMDHFVAMRKMYLSFGDQKINSNEFKIIMESLLKSPTSSKHKTYDLKRALESNYDENYSIIKRYALTNSELLEFWSNFEAANFCVNNKLKTNLGKPQDTLTTIEKVIRQCLTLDNIVEKHDKIYALLSFYESLVKVITNAWSAGSAYHSRTPSKTVITFFVANKKTCNDWINRMRIAVIDLAYKVQDYDYVIRQGETTLPYLLNNNEEFDKAVAQVAVSLCKTGAFQDLYGLYDWCKEKSGKKFRWIRTLVELIENKTESAIKKFDFSTYSEESFNQHIPEPLQDVCCNYKEMVDQYKNSIKSWTKYESTYLDTLSQFNDGLIPTTILGGQQQSSCSTLEDLFNISHMKLLTAGACIQTNYPKSWSGNTTLINSLRIADTNLKKLIGIGRLTPKMKEQVIILGMVHKEMESLVLTNKTTEQLDRLLIIHDSKETTSESLILIKKWGDFFVRNVRSGHDPNLHFTLNLKINLAIAKAARKETNYGTVKLYLHKALCCGNNLSIFDYVKSVNFHNILLSTEKASCFRQMAKLSHVLKEDELAVRTMSGIAVSIGHMFFIDPSSNSNNNNQLFEISSRALHNLATWFQQDPSLMEKVYPDMICSTPEIATVSQILEIESSMVGSVDFLFPSNVDDSDMVIGKLLRLAVIQSPLIPKFWETFAHWSQNIGDKMIENEDNYIRLTMEEEQTIISVLGGCESTIQIVCGLLSQKKLQTKNSNGEEINDKREFMKKELLDCEALKDAHPDVIEALFSIWQAIHKRVYFYYETATHAYFQFIHHSSNSQSSKVISATLRLLQLTVKYALELQDPLEVGLKTTQSHKWKAIIPQLFSRLNHPVKIVRTRISELLCRLAVDYPHFVIYPAVVGSLTNDKLLNFNSSSSSTEEEEEEENRENPIMRSAYAKIVEVMNKLCPESIQQVEKFVTELQRISVLWEELWLGTLTQYSNEIARRVRKMEDELKKLDANENLNDETKFQLVKDKYDIIFKPILFVLDKITKVTTAVPETPNETAFNKKYGEFISNTMSKLRSPEDPTRPRDSWNLLMNFQKNLASKALKRNSLRLSEISPNLKTLAKKSRVPMPGIADNPSLHIDGFHGTLTILMTKTKPKKVWLRGNDGRKYGYLFKGLEDLHLDERIMQFLEITNNLMKKKEYSARYYSVVPLGPRSGLIQWVEGAVPLFALYKKWQERKQIIDEVALKKKRPAAPNDEPLLSKKILKPSEAFYSKLIPLLREQRGNIKSLDNRRSWPIEVLLQVFQELVDETPDDLISQELWFASNNSKHWFSLSRNLTRSIAVMSTIGYVLGLGDRHLDNLLIDFNTGEIIHIDYNVCFEKGKNLRIPEKVPCRLTQNLVKIFGVTGVDGVFRLSCEDVIGTLRKSKETLLTLLEAFVYDPLVDWTPGVDSVLTSTSRNNDGGGRPGAGGGDEDDKRELQTEITFSMFSVRITEMTAPWIENKTDLYMALETIEESINNWMDVSSGIQGYMEDLTKMHKCMSVLIAAEANPHHGLYDLPPKFVEYIKANESCEKVNGIINEAIHENEKWNNAYLRAFSNLSPQSLTKLTDDLMHTPYRFSGDLATNLIAQFLDNAGQGTLGQQIYGVESNFIGQLDKFKADLGTCIELFSHYSTLNMLYSEYNLKDEHPTYKNIKWLHELKDNMDIDNCRRIREEFELFSSNKGNFLQSRREEGDVESHNYLITLNYNLENWCREASKYRSHLAEMLNSLEEMSNKYVDLYGLVEQRAKWACGANPDLQDIFDSYSTQFNREIEFYKNLISASKVIMITMNTLLQYEALKSMKDDAKEFERILKQAGEAANLKEKAKESKNILLNKGDPSSELALFLMNPPLSGRIDSPWIRKTEEIIKRRVQKIESDLKAQNVVLNGHLKIIHENVSDDLKSTMSSHQKLMSDAGVLLQTIDESAIRDSYDLPEVSTYLENYKTFSELVSYTIKKVMSNADDDSWTELIGHEILMKIEKMKDMIPNVYNELINFPNLFKEDRKRTNMVKEDNDNHVDSSSSSSKQVNTEEKNTFALNVLRRIRIKLEGREPDALRQSSVPEQIDFIIRESLNFQNLALMYEGWTPWI